MQRHSEPSSRPTLLLQHEVAAAKTVDADRSRSVEGAGLKRVLVLIPAYNEESTVGTVVEDVLSAGFDVLVIDDGSADRTAIEASNAGSAVVSLPVNLGVGGALENGIQVRGETWLRRRRPVRRDGQHPPPGHPEPRRCRRTNRQSPLGWRAVSPSGPATMKVGPARRVVMRYLARAASKATGAKITDATSGFRVISEPLLSEFAQTFPADYLGDTYEALITAGRGGYRVAESACSDPPAGGGRVLGISGSCGSVHRQSRDRRHHPDTVPDPPVSTDSGQCSRTITRRTVSRR